MSNLRKRPQRQSNRPSSEPFWMQDIRLAQAAIDRQRRVVRAARQELARASKSGGRSASSD